MSLLSLPVIDLDLFLSEPQNSEAVIQECKKASPTEQLCVHTDLKVCGKRRQQTL